MDCQDKIKYVKHFILVVTNIEVKLQLYLVDINPYIYNFGRVHQKQPIKLSAGL